MLLLLHLNNVHSVLYGSAYTHTLIHTPKYKKNQALNLSVYGCKTFNTKFVLWSAHKKRRNI